MFLPGHPPAEVFSISTRILYLLQSVNPKPVKICQKVVLSRNRLHYNSIHCKTESPVLWAIDENRGTRQWHFFQARSGTVSGEKAAFNCLFRLLNSPVLQLREFPVHETKTPTTLPWCWRTRNSHALSVQYCLHNERGLCTRYRTSGISKCITAYPRFFKFERHRWWSPKKKPYEFRDGTDVNIKK